MYAQPMQPMAQPMMMAPAQPMAQPMYAPPPPPPQANNTNTNTNTNVNIVMGGGNSEKEKKEGPFPFELPQFPCKGSCPQCKEYVTTAVVRRWSCCCWVTFICLALFGGLIGWIIICCLCSNEGNKTSYHRCPRCG